MHMSSATPTTIKLERVLVDFCDFGTLLIYNAVGLHLTDSKYRANLPNLPLHPLRHTYSDILQVSDYI